MIAFFHTPGDRESIQIKKYQELLLLLWVWVGGESSGNGVFEEYIGVEDIFIDHT